MVKKNERTLIEQLKRQKADAEHFIQMVDEYISYYDQLSKMQKDIKDRGITCKSVPAAGNNYEQDTPAVKVAAMLRKQKLAILKRLGISTNNVLAEDSNEL